MLELSPKALIIIPTYNEIENISSILEAIFSHVNNNKLNIDFHVLVVDDDSFDGTGKKVLEFSKSNPKVFVIIRKGKKSFSKSYMDGFQWGQDKGYDFFFQMDADFSHDPKYLLPMLEKVKKESFNCVVGSRYFERKISVINWPIERMILSLAGMAYVHLILGPITFGSFKVRDSTAGFKCFDRTAMGIILSSKCYTDGFLFQTELLYKIQNSKLRSVEIPIVFVDRLKGDSKMKLHIIVEALLLPLKLRFLHLIGKL